MQNTKLLNTIYLENLQNIKEIELYAQTFLFLYICDQIVKKIQSSDIKPNRIYIT